MDEANLLIKVMNGIYRLSPSSKVAPRSIVHQGQYLYRFMDFLYTDQGDLENLSVSQVVALCHERAKNPESIEKGGANLLVKRIFTQFVNQLQPGKLFEFGAGKSPLLDACRNKMTYVLADTDSALIDLYVKNKRHAVLFSDQTTLPFPDGYFDMIVSVFVFHFHIFNSQIIEMSRCLSEKGLILANVYRRNEASRLGLIAAFSKHGLEIRRLRDNKDLCLDNEYWVIGKCQASLSSATRSLRTLTDSI